MKRVGVLIVLVVVLIFGFFLWWFNGQSPVSPTDTSARRFLILPGTPIREIGTKLKQEGFIKDPVIFFLFVKSHGYDRTIQAGDYQLSGSMNLSDIVNTLNHGVQDIWVTFPEGMRADEYAEILEKKLPSYNAGWRESLTSKNGYLFPDTYLIPRSATVEEVMAIFKGTFNKKIAEIGIEPDNLQLSEIVTKASLIEREAKTDAERPVIAGIINNRLSDGMALQIDATLQYIKGYNNERKRWWNSVDPTDKQIDSPYNTYKYAGLPPGPIANPGVASLKAAVNPAVTVYYYYLHDKDGVIHYARTLSEHNANIKRYL